MDDRQLITQLQVMGRVEVPGGISVASLLADLNSVGLGPEEVEIVGLPDSGLSHAFELVVVDRDTEPPDE